MEDTRLVLRNAAIDQTPGKSVIKSCKKSKERNFTCHKFSNKCDNAAGHEKNVCGSSIDFSPRRSRLLGMACLGHTLGAGQQTTMHEKLATFKLAKAHTDKGMNSGCGCWLRESCQQEKMKRLLPKWFNYAAAKCILMGRVRGFGGSFATFKVKF